jgi:tetratricopeptide (TPR) repeat protein
MSVVYRATDTLEGCDVALKVMRLTDDDPRNALYLQQEFRSMSRLIHPKLVRVYDYGFIEKSVPFFTMELLPGEDLSSVGKLSLESIYHILISLADVFAFMHARGYVHRDVKPSNVRLLPTVASQPLDIRLMDCGLTEEQGRMGSSVAGTLSYLAPEAWLGAPTDARGDLYSLGVLAYEISTGQLPFDASTGVRLLKSKTERPKDLRELRPDVPPAFARLVRDLLAPEPANRPVSAMEVLTRLNKFTEVFISPDPLTYLRMPSLVGRNKELSQIRRALTEAEQGKCVALTVMGPAGAGKTRLFDEALLEAGLRGAFIARSSGRGFAGGVYGVYRDLLARLLQLPTAKRLVVELGGEEALAPKGKVVTGETAAYQDDPVYARQALHHRFGRFLGDVSQHQFILLAIDDLHLADAASLDALASILSASTHGNIAVLATLRTGEKQSPALEYFLTLNHRLELARMTKGQIGELITGAFGPTQPSVELLADLERLTEGNVYFVLEILRELTAHGLIEKRRTFVQLPSCLQGIDLPHTLVEALQRRVHGLSKPAFYVGRICATVGRDLDFALARSLVDYDDETFLDAVDELRRFELLELSEQRIRLHHARIQDVFLADQLDAERRQMHLRVAEAIEQLRPNDGRDLTAELGHHYDEAAQAPRALEYLIAAGDLRYDGYAYSDAQTVYRRAYDLMHAASRAERANLECKLNDRLGRICFYHDHQNGHLYLEQARKNHLDNGCLWLIEPLGRLFGAAIAVTVALCLTVVKDALLGRKYTWRNALGHLLDSFAATTYLANCYTYSGRINRALDAAEKLRPLVYSKQRLPQAGYQLSRVYGLVLANRFDEAVAGSKEALRILAEDKRTPITTHDRVHAEGGALITLVWADLSRGHVQDSEYLQRFEVFVLNHPTALLESWLLEVKVFVAYRRGLLNETRMAWELLIHKSSQAEVQFVRNKARVWLGLACLDAGQASLALDIADDVIAVAREKKNPMLWALGLKLRGLAHRAWEQLDEAAKCFEEACELLLHPDVGAVEVYHSVLICRASLALEQGRPELARTLAEQVATANRTQVLSHDRHLMQVARLLGRVAIAEGRATEGLEDLKRALTIATKLGDRLEQAYSWFSLSLAQSMSDSTAAITSRQKCETILLEIGNDYQLRRLGLRGSEDPTSNGRGGVLRRVWQLVGDARESEDARSQQVLAARMNVSVRTSRHDETLPAAETSDTEISPTLSTEAPETS